MLSHDTRLRCDLVDVYHTLYGTKRPVCIPLLELSGIMNLSKHEPMKKIKTPIPRHSRDTTAIINEDLLKTTRSLTPNREGSQQILLETVECMNVEVVASEEKPKVRFIQ